MRIKLLTLAAVLLSQPTFAATTEYLDGYLFTMPGNRSLIMDGGIHLAFEDACEASTLYYNPLYGRVFNPQMVFNATGSPRCLVGKNNSGSDFYTAIYSYNIDYVTPTAIHANASNVSGKIYRVSHAFATTWHSTKEEACLAFTQQYHAGTNSDHRVVHYKQDPTAPIPNPVPGFGLNFHINGSSGDWCAFADRNLLTQDVRPMIFSYAVANVGQFPTSPASTYTMPTTCEPTMPWWVQDIPPMWSSLNVPEDAACHIRVDFPSNN